MADAASITMSATILTDEIAKTIAGLTAGHTPADSDENWYYKTTSITTAVSKNLIVGSLLDEPAVGVAHDVVEPATDLIKFVFVQNTSGSIPIYLYFNSVAVVDFVTTAVNALVIPVSSTWFGNFTTLTVDGLNARTATGTAVCKVAAIIETNP